MPFKPGASGNPNGKKPGTLNRRTQLAKLLEPHAEELIEKLVNQAKQGEPMALKLCIERLLPRIKPDESIIFDLPNGELTDSTHITQTAEEIVKAVASGQLSIKEGRELAKLIDEQRQAIHSEKKSLKLDLFSR